MVNVVSVECSRNVRKITSENIISSKNKPETGRGTKSGIYTDALSTEVEVRRNENSDSVPVGLNKKKKKQLKKIHPGASTDRGTS